MTEFDRLVGSALITKVVYVVYLIMANWNLILLDVRTL